MRPFKLNPTTLAAKAREVGNSNAQKQCLLDVCQEHLDLLALAAGEPVFELTKKLDERGKPVLDDKREPVMLETQKIDCYGQPVFKDVGMSDESLLLYGVASTLVQLLRNEWTYK